MIDRLLVLIAATSTLAAAALLLRPHPPEYALSAGDLLERLDRDGDGAVSAPEYAAASDGALPFSAADADASGALDARELELLLAFTSPLMPLDNNLPRVR